jgi:ADP-ribose pyrophosphatase YjhB (NUDIX family)
MSALYKGKDMPPNAAGVSMGRTRSQAIVVRQDRILMVKHTMDGRDFYCLPGGGVESGETPEEAALRELMEEACVKGHVVQRTTVRLKPDQVSEVYSFWIEIPDTAEPAPGIDPELSAAEQSITGVSWMRLEELSALDQIYLWSSGLKSIPVFYEKLNQMKK